MEPKARLWELAPQGILFEPQEARPQVFDQDFYNTDTESSWVQLHALTRAVHGVNLLSLPQSLVYSAAANRTYDTLWLPISEKLPRRGSNVFGR